MGLQDGGRPDHLHATTCLLRLGSGLARLICTIQRAKAFGAAMDLNTITTVAHPQTRAQVPVWTPGDAWLAGGTWQFSEPQEELKQLHGLRDL